jgi:hypothetical protein
MKKIAIWFKTLIFSIAVSLLSIAGFNYAVDTNMVFHPENIKVITEKIMDGHMVSYNLNISDRRIQSLVVEDSDTKIDTVIIGSSRSAQVGIEHFNKNAVKGTFWNNSVAGAGFEDFLGITGIYIREGYLPKMMLIFVDPWIFNKNNFDSRYKDIESEYNLAKNIIFGDNSDSKEVKSPLSGLSALTSLDYTKENLKSLFRGNEYEIVEKRQPKKFVRGPGGRIYYPLERDDSKRIMADIKSFISPPVYRLEGFDSIDHTKRFESYIKYLTDNDVDVALALTPYPPFVYDFLTINNNYKVIISVENYILDFAAKKDLQVLGSYSPYKLNLSNSDFLDGMHPKDYIYTEILAPYNR